MRNSAVWCFNSQPPEGGWDLPKPDFTEYGLFQLTAARRRLVDGRLIAVVLIAISTHSRAKAAGSYVYAENDRLT